MHARPLTAALVTAVLILAGATTASAEGGFGQCPGIASRPNHHYALTQDTTCDAALFEDDANVNLAGHTLFMTGAMMRADRVTLAHGNLRMAGIIWWGTAGRLDDLDVTEPAPGQARGFFIDANGLTVTHCRFHDLPRSMAISFYWGGAGSVSGSTFTRTASGVGIQQNSGVTIKNNVFRSNGNAINLVNEDDRGTDNATVTGNIIDDSARNGIKVRFNEVRADWSFANTLIAHNRISHSGESGIDITLRCVAARCPVVEHRIVVSNNILTHNGEAAPAAAPSAVEPEANDAESTRPAHTTIDGTVSTDELSPATEGVVPATDGTTTTASETAALSDDGITVRLVSGFSYTPPISGLEIIELAKNTTSQNADRGIDALGVTDGGRNVSRRDHNPEPCLGVVCRVMH